jgi:hypothetical protein
MSVGGCGADRLLGEFVRDVERAEQEVHVLTPTRYEVNRRAVDRNEGLVFGEGE